MKKVAIVILNWNGAAMMRRFLPSVIEHSADVADIIVADNDSKDDSLALLKAEFPTVRTIVLDKNYGFAGGYNRALEQVNYEYYMLLNSDVEAGLSVSLTSWIPILRLLRVSQSFVPSIRATCLSMLVQAVDTLTVMVIRSVADVYSIQ